MEEETAGLQMLAWWCEMEQLLQRLEVCRYRSRAGILDAASLSLLDAAASPAASPSSGSGMHLGSRGWRRSRLRVYSSPLLTRTLAVWPTCRYAFRSGTCGVTSLCLIPCTADSQHLAYSFPALLQLLEHRACTGCSLTNQHSPQPHC